MLRCCVVSFPPHLLCFFLSTSAFAPSHSSNAIVIGFSSLEDGAASFSSLVLNDFRLILDLGELALRLEDEGDDEAEALLCLFFFFIFDVVDVFVFVELVSNLLLLLLLLLPLPLSVSLFDLRLRFLLFDLVLARLEEEPPLPSLDCCAFRFFGHSRRLFRRASCSSAIARKS